MLRNRLELPPEGCPAGCPLQFIAMNLCGGAVRPPHRNQAVFKASITNDNSLIFFGSSLSDGNLHSCVDLPIAMFGAPGGRIRPRGHVFTPPGTPISQLHRTTLNWYGIEAEDFDDTGAKLLPGIG